MDNQCREYLDNRQNANAKRDLLDDEDILQDGVGTVADTLLQKIEGKHAANKPEHERIPVDRWRAVADLEDEPEDHGQYDRQQECPEDTEVGTEVPGFEVAPGQFGNEVAAPEKFG